MTTSTFQPECIRAALADLEKKRATIESWAETAADVEVIFQAHAAALPHSRMSIGWEFGALQGIIAQCGGFGSEALHSIRDVFPLLRALRAAGFKPKGADDYAEIGRRTYHYQRDGEGQPTVHVSAFLNVGENAEGANCRFEKVGVKEEPVYKLICDGEVVEQEAVA